jgi:NAD(P)H-dependent FMN reductase
MGCTPRRCPEYSHGPSTALKNAFDFLYCDWNNQSVGFVGYGGSRSARGVEILRQMVNNIELADSRAQGGLSVLATEDVARGSERLASVAALYQTTLILPRPYGRFEPAGGGRGCLRNPAQLRS